MKFKTIEEMVKEIAERALDEYKYNGKTIREWADILSKENCVEVVRCKDCKHKYNEDSPEDLWCYWVDIDEDDFCSHGERKNDLAK